MTLTPIAERLWSILAEHDAQTAQFGPYTTTKPTHHTTLSICDGCKTSILCGPIFTCKSCTNIDFCASCHQNTVEGHDPSHMFTQRDPTLIKSSAEDALLAAGLRQCFDALLKQLDVLKETETKVDFNTIELQDGMYFVDVFAGFTKKITGKSFLLNEDGIKAVEQLVNHFDLNLAIVQPTLDSNTLLSAIPAGNVTYIEYLLNHPQVIQADLVNSRQEKDLTPLHLAALCDEPEIVRLLLNHGADINAEILQDSKDPNSPRFTLLQFMIQGGHIRSRPESVNVLLEYGARLPTSVGRSGTFKVGWGGLYIHDPGHDLPMMQKEPQTGIFGRSLGVGLSDVVPGTWHWETELIESPAWGERVKTLTAWYGGEKERIGSSVDGTETPWSVAVDGGRVAIVDALKWNAVVKAGTEGDVCGFGSHGEAVGTFGVVVSSGVGDGIYPVHVRKTADMVVGVRVEFLDDGFTQPHNASEGGCSIM